MLTKIRNNRNKNNIGDILKMNRFILFFFVCFFLAQCSYNKLPVSYLTLSKQIDEVSDTLLLYDIKCLTFNDEKLYFTNPAYDQIIILNRNLEFVRTIGKSGMGPNELLGISQFAICDTLLSVLNVTNRRVNIFSTEGDAITEISIDNSILFDPGYRYCFTGTEIIGCSSVAETPLSKYNIYTHDQTLFGETYNFTTPRQTLIRNNRFTAKVNNSIITVSNNLPYIEMYNEKDLNQIILYDYSNFHQIEKNIRAIDSKSDKEDNSYYHLCEDIYLTDQHLYILLIDYSNNDFNVNQIVKYDIYPTLMPVSIYKLPGKYFTTFCVSEEDEVIYAYHYTDNTLGKYLVNNTTQHN